MGAVGFVNLFFDGKLLIENSKTFQPGETFYTLGSIEKRVVIPNLVKGQPYSIEARGEYRWQPSFMPLPHGIRLGASRIIDPQESLQCAVDLAKTSDLAIVVVGLNGEIETEGYDRKNIDLPGHPNALVGALFAANPNTIVITQTGMPVEMPWADKAHTLVQSFYGGNEVGNGLADVLFGKINPSGRLPVSFPRRLKDNPTSFGYGIETANPGRVIYNEGVYVGYRYYESFNVPVAFPFGYGLSYTTFEYSGFEVSPINIAGQFQVVINVKNTGKLAGKEVVQGYIGDVVSSSVKPILELKGFTVISLSPGQSRTVIIKLARDGLRFWDERRDWWTAEKAELEVLVGSTIRDPNHKATVSLERLAWRDRDERH